MKNLNLFRKSARGSEGSTLASAVVRPSFDRRLTVVKHLAFMLLFLLGSLNVWGAKITNVANIESGKTYYIGATTSNTDYYFSVNGSTASSSVVAGTAITDKSSAATFVFTQSGSNWTIKFSDSDNYLSLSSSKNNGKVIVNTTANWTISNNTSKSLLTLACGNTYALQKNNSGTQFGSYAKTQTDVWLEEVPSGSSDPTILKSIAVSGDLTNKNYETTDALNLAGLTVTGSYDDDSEKEITSGITWKVRTNSTSEAVNLDAYTLTAGQTSVEVQATVNEVSSNWKTITGLTVTAASPKITITQNEVADFAASYAEYTWTAGGVSGKLYAYKNAGMQFNPSKTGYYVYNTDPIPGRITKITMTKASGTDRSWTPYVSTTAMTSASGTALDAQTVTSTGVSWDVTGSNSYFYLTVSGGATVIGSIVIEYTEDAPPAIDAPSISGDVNFVGSTTVTISHEDADHIYYTTNGDAPTTSSAEYTAPFPLTNTATVKAIAVKGSDVSAVAEKTFTKVEALESLAALLDATTSTETAFNVVISDWVVTGVSGTRAWIADAANEKGILLYKSGHNFVAGNKLNGVVLGTKTKLYQGYPELTTLLASDVTVTTAEAITPRTTTIAALTSGYNKEQGTVVKLENLTYTASSTSFSDGENSIQADNKLYTASLLDGATYNLTGVVEYLNGSVVKIMPRSVDDVELTGEASLPEVTGLAALKAETTGSSYLLNLTDAVVTLVDGNNAFIEDATTGALIYFSGHGFAAGDKLNGQYEVTTATYQGKFEITAMEAQAGATKTADAEIPVTTLTIAQVEANFAANESKRIKIVGVNVTDAIANNDRNGQISDGANTFALYAGKNGITAAENANIDVIGYPTFFNEAHQFNVWAQADITVNEKEDPELAWDPISATIAAGDPWSTPALTNPHSVTISSYASNNESVATVTDAGVIALAGGIGTAVITAHFNGDATYAAADATYTITVNAAGTYSMSFDLSRASYDDAADEEVVWNSNVVTITAQKNTGTKVTNYLAGNYSSGTLIAETRLYENNILAFTPKAGVTITKVEWHATAKAYAESLAKEGTTTAWTNATAALDGTDDKLVIITPSAAGEFSAVLGKSGSNKGTRALSVVVFYTAESEKAKLTASISIDDMNMAVGDADILLSAIAATSNPNKKAISYEVTSGTAVTIEGTGAEAALHAAAAGSATITATIPDDLGNYTGATTTFAITVTAAATLESIAISGTATELEYTEGQSFNPAGLTVMGHYSNGSDAEITSGIDWTFAPDPLTEGTTSVSVTATVETISSDAIVVNGLTVSGPAPIGDNYVKVTASQADWSGDYLLVYEDGENAYVWNGDYSDGANNYASATISSNTIAKPAAAAVITIAAASEGKYTLQVNGDKYFQDNGSNSKLIFTDAIADAAEVTISYETDWTKLLFSERCIRFNNTSGQMRFRFYAASGQQAIQLYKKVVEEPEYTTVRSGLTPNGYYTVCLDRAVTAVRGASFWTLKNRDNAGTMVYLEEEIPSEEHPFAAGKPFIIQATAAALEVVYTGNSTTTAGTNGALRGTLEDMSYAELQAKGEHIYLLIQNAIHPIASGNFLNANRAYIDYDALTAVSSAPLGAPGRRVKSMPMAPQVATGVDQVPSDQVPNTKVLINGQLYIMYNGTMYNVQGQLVK